MLKHINLTVNINDGFGEEETGFYCLLNCDETVSDEEMLIVALERYIQELELKDFKNRHCKFNRKG